jgi:chemotaxis protein methyltransferase CheR
MDHGMKLAPNNRQAQPAKGNFHLGHGDYLRFRDLVLQRSGLHFPDKKQADLELGLDKALRSIPASLAEQLCPLGLDLYYHFLKEAATPAARAEMDRLINLLTVGETHFFRDSAQFEALATYILPELIAHKRAAAAAAGPHLAAVPCLRLWSAGCSTGEEAYSLAMLLHELIPDLKNWHILILATDINQGSLTRARQALYSDWSFRESRARISRSLYFTPQGKFYRLCDPIRQMVTFAPLNLIEDNFPSPHNNTVSMDLIICRNVTIYFTEETTRRLVHKFYRGLAQEGWLVVGHADLSLTTYRAFQARSFPNTVIYQKAGQSTSEPADGAGREPLNGNRPSRTLPVRPIVSAPSQPAQAGSRDLNGSSSRPDSSESPKPNSAGNLKTKPLSAQGTAPGSLPKANSSGTSTEPDPYHMARLRLHEGYADQVILTLEAQLDKVPECRRAQAYCLLARAYANLGRWTEARRWAESAIALDSLLPEAYYTLALIYEQQGNAEQAIAYLKKVIYLDRAGPLPYFNLAILYKKRAERASARRTLNNIVKILGQWPAEQIIPDSGGTSAARLLNISQQILKELEAGL